MSWLVLNTGSSSLKFGLFDASCQDASVHGSVNWQGDQATLKIRQADRDAVEHSCDAKDPGGAAAAALEAVLATQSGKEPILGVGHRIVHGGTRFRDSIRIDREVEQDIQDLTVLAPLHNPPALAGLAAAQQVLPDVPQVAVFDTAFFQDLPRASAILPVPWQWTDEWQVRRFGFHGISHGYCAERAAAILNRPPETLRLVICHLGNGCSASAVRGGRPIETSMSFTPLDGLMMGTRSGSIDPSIVLYLLKNQSLSGDQIEDALNHRSGLLGVSGVAGDYRQVEAAAQGGNDRARLAIEIYVARVRAEIGALAATLGGIDALVFAAGVGENSATLRAAACEGLEFMGVRLDSAENEASPVDADIAAADSAARVLVIHTREELMIARETRRVLEPTR